MDYKSEYQKYLTEKYYPEQYLNNRQITIQFLKQELKIQNNHLKKFTKKEWRKVITIKITSLKQVLELLEGKK